MRITPIQSKLYASKVNSFKNATVSNENVLANDREKNNDKKYSKYAIPAGLILVGGIGIKCLLPKKSSSIRDGKSDIIIAKDYIETLAESLGEYLNKKIDAKNLKSIMSGEDLLKELKNLKKENFIASKENIEKGIFTADLHSHTLYSDGNGKVEEILTQVAEYADRLNKKNGKKFIFALTDHDSVGGTKEALKLISENPEKYKNVRFVVGSEMSFLIKADKNGRPFETSEMLVYGFNPFDKNISEYFDNLYAKRKNMITDYIKDLNEMFSYADFSLEEFNNTYGKNYLMNYSWKVHHYGQTKNAVSGLAISQGKNKEEMYKEVMSKTGQFKKTLHDLREAGLVPKDYGDDTRITDMCLNKYNPKWNGDKIDYASEANFEDIIKVFGEDINTFGAFAHPYYITERNSNAENLIDELIKKSNGFIKATESHHQSYKKTVDMQKVEELNKFIASKENILELGGRDNHKVDWLKK